MNFPKPSELEQAITAFADIVGRDDCGVAAFAESAAELFEEAGLGVDKAVHWAICEGFLRTGVKSKLVCQKKRVNAGDYGTEVRYGSTSLIISRVYGGETQFCIEEGESR